MVALNSRSFLRLVNLLKTANKTCAVVEQCCGGLIASSIMGQTGASKVFIGGSVAYNTKFSKPLLLNNDSLYESILHRPAAVQGDSEEETYMKSKMHWTAETSVAYCQQLKTDYVIAESGASGPTFRPKDMTTGFASIAIATRNGDGIVSLVHHEIVRSSHADRQRNMREFADSAAEALYRVVSMELETPTKIHQLIPSDCFASRDILNRATHLRSQEEAQKSLRSKSSTRFLLLHGTKILCEDKVAPKYLDHQALDEAIAGKCHRISFLGIKPDGSALFSVDLLDEIAHRDLVDTRTSAPMFHSLDREAVLYATALAQWQRRTRHCCQCGGAIDFIEAGSCALCSSCDHKSWPRQDPSMIAVVLSPDRERVLLARSKRHPPKVYSTLAGFVEAGETVEAAVAREVWEEVGVRVHMDSVKYVASQPWPFPQSTMLGFSVTTDDTIPLNVDTNEIECAKWFDRVDVRASAEATSGLATMQPNVARSLLESRPDLKLILPSKGVIARQLIDNWLEHKI